MDIDQQSSIIDSGVSENSDPPSSTTLYIDVVTPGALLSQLTNTNAQNVTVEAGHSRNSSNTSQVNTVLVYLF